MRRLLLLSCLCCLPLHHAKADMVVIEENFFGERSSIFGTVYWTSGEVTGLEFVMFFGQDFAPAKFVYGCDDAIDVAAAKRITAEFVKYVNESKEINPIQFLTYLGHKNCKIKSKSRRW